MRERYVRIFVHADVLEGARIILEDLEDEAKAKHGDDYNEDAYRALKDLVDPLPEKDIFGHTPSIEYLELPVT